MTGIVTARRHPTRGQSRFLPKPGGATRAVDASRHFRQRIRGMRGSSLNTTPSSFLSPTAFAQLANCALVDRL